ncbi:MAG: MATE family efflux transporter [Sphaerochaetaceae bacterium]|nr:MATE family efflux transporter [Spirochaetales bacterium]MDY5498716.1 MATE family efflux transporter [Sphaerochaetaceae bacterium]
MTKHDSFLRKFLSIAIPVLLQQILQNSLNFVDSLMVAQLGETAIAAVGLAGQVNFLIILLFFGVSTACSIFLAQFYGAGNQEGIRKITAFAFNVAFVGATIFFLSATFAPERVMGIFTKDEAVIQSGVEYMRTLGFGFFFLAFTQIYGVGLRATDRAVIPMAASIVSMVTNIFLDWVMIFGHLGCPAMREGRAALATSLSRLVEAVIVVVAVHRLKSPCKIGLRDLAVPVSFIRSVLPTCLPVVCNEFFWALGMALYKVAYARQGVAAIAAVNVNESVSNLFTTAIFAVSSTTLVMIGQKIGEGMLDEVHRYCRRFVGLSFGIGALMGLLFFVMSPLMARAFRLEGEISRIALRCMWVTALILPLRSFDYTLVTGILRAGGDTRFSMFCELGCVWLVGVPMAFLGSAVLHLPMWQVYLMVYLEEVAKAIFGLARIRSGKWLHNLSTTS